ncbi:MAG: MSHA biogenesis protein MshQ [Phenylobacterium sp.]|jgi:MSHA biogenesis protein MshQ
MENRILTTIMFKVWLLTASLMLMFSATLRADQCSAIFADGSSNSAAAQLTPFAFSATVDLTVKAHQSATTVNSVYNTVKLEEGAELTFASLTDYGITTLALGRKATLYLPAGNYYISDMQVAHEASIVPIGAGTVRLYLSNDVDFAEHSKLNAGGNASQVFIYAYNKITTGYDARLNGYIYAVDKVTLGEKTQVKGAISAKALVLGHNANIIYDNGHIAHTDFADLCTNYSTLVTPLVAEYRFDECSLANTIIDSQGNYDATGQGLSDASANAVIGQSLDLQAGGVKDWVEIPSEAVNRLDNMTISVWVNTSVSKSQQEIFHALGTSTRDDQLEIFLRNRNTVYLKVRGNNIELDSNKTLTDGQWHQLVVTRQGTWGCLYVDGAFQRCTNGLKSGRLSVTNDKAVVLGQEQDRFGGGFSSSQSFEGHLDELRIYSGLIAAADITEFYNNEKAGKNYNGTSRTPPSCNNDNIPLPVAEYQFDESSYTGAANEVVDSIGGFHGSAILAQPVSGKVCNAVDFSATNVADYISLAKGSLHGRKTFSVSLWAKTAKSSAQSTISGTNKQHTDAFSMWFERATSFDPYQKNKTSGSIATSTIADNQWHHLVWTQSDSKECFYRDKVLQSCNAHKAAKLKIDTLILGQELENGSDRMPRKWAFEGLIDELLIFGPALSAGQIATVYDNQNGGKGYDGSIRNCFSATDIDHYQIIHDGEALTCAAESVIIKACLDAACSNVYPDPITLNLTVGNTVVATPTITKDSGSVSFNYTSAGKAILSVSGASQAAVNGQTCLLGAADNCEMAFATSGFLVNMTEGESCLANNVTIQAVKQSDTGTHCAPAWSGEQTVDLSFDYVRPNSHSTIPALDNIAMAAAGGSQQRSLTFGPTASAELSLTYADAGPLKLTVSASGSGPLAGLILSGSDTATYYPGQLAISAKIGETVLNNIASSGAPTQFAGSNFSLEIAAQCGNGTATPNYQPETVNSIEIGAKRTAPDNSSGGVDGNLWVNYQNVILAADLNGFSSIVVAPTDFTNGKVTVSANYSEVGLIQLDARDKNYYGTNAGASIDAAAIDVGRFIPGYFILDQVSAPTFTGHCASGDTPFVYTGQYTNTQTPAIGRLGFAVVPSFTISPFNITGTITKNYVGDFNSLSVSKVIRTLPATDKVQKGADNLSLMKLSANTTDGSLSVFKDSDDNNIDWITQYTYSLYDNFTYLRDANALIDEFTSSIDFIVAGVSDNDGVASIGGLTQNASGIKVRYGRWVIGATYGPQTATLAVPMSQQTYNGSKFITNQADNCTDFSASQVSLKDISLNPALTSASGSGLFVDGKTMGLLLDPPGIPGQIEVKYTVPSWLGADVNGDGDFNPTAIVTFGQYRGNDRVIYWREKR